MAWGWGRNRGGGSGGFHCLKNGVLANVVLSCCFAFVLLPPVPEHRPVAMLLGPSRWLSFKQLRKTSSALTLTTESASLKRMPFGTLFAYCQAIKVLYLTLRSLSSHSMLDVSNAIDSTSSCSFASAVISYVNLHPASPLPSFREPATLWRSSQEAIITNPSRRMKIFFK